MIGVMGATGELGGRVAARLSQQGHRQRLLVRDPSRAPRLEGSEVSSFAGYEDVPGMREVFEGVGALLFVSAGENPQRVQLHRNVVEAAVGAGVERIVYTSFIGAAPDAVFTFARDHFHTENLLRESGVPFTFSRHNLYLDFLPGMVGDDGVIRGPAGDGRFAPVLRDDAADALVAMLTTDGHEGAAYELTGPEAVTMAEVAGLLGRHGDRAVVYESETLEEARGSRSGYGAADWEVDGWITSYAAIAAGELDVVTGDVERLAGHPPTSVEAYLTD